MPYCTCNKPYGDLLVIASHQAIFKYCLEFCLPLSETEEGEHSMERRGHRRPPKPRMNRSVSEEVLDIQREMNEAQLGMRRMPNTRKNTLGKISFVFTYSISMRNCTFCLQQNPEVKKFPFFWLRSRATQKILYDRLCSVLFFFASLLQETLMVQTVFLEMELILG